MPGAVRGRMRGSGHRASSMSVGVSAAVLTATVVVVRIGVQLLPREIDGQENAKGSRALA